MLISLLRFIIDPFNIFWILLFTIFGAWIFKKERLLKWLVIISGIWFLIISTPMVPVALLNSLEDNYNPLRIEHLNNTEAKYHIVVLGGGHGFDDRLPANSLLSTQALARLSEGIRIHRRLPNSKLVLSGYSSSGRTSQAEMLQKTALLLGVDKNSILIQSEPANTYEEAGIYSEKFFSDDRTVILVTSAAHMPRAMGVFNHFDIDPIPSPAHYRVLGSRKDKIFGWPSDKNISLLRTGINEYAARIRDWVVLH